ncbi:putative ETC complex I subunit conserved region [Dinoroseobacter shibae DFL 12 = DSM 16493]|jgi:NADH dehydrogenase|uniref:Putative ETC complex I subunit conserved region n=1 Tax=Dinoroseobacter shibae (strain DSM 16493 / NCIMB 14021 / DFL 12) TaxID=398580 RepID=A8LQR0_DINSH|nr:MULTISPECIES: ETC complex I subunit [Dinoroseobacter]ABV93927.1 putative ETC complex I subunit conserved region [Dinoroseobacter shibae DFL 12 = DSM 16493]MDD9716558.1 ETC complex I subunit [Dinoroseobacter sp. PD6]URF45375.1 ETC complex I subunit [Dinoroseobacter shibae]URF49680.1 ETC complex I subunit [Dinoroseobacter shibae]
MRARIYQPARTAMSSGQAKTKGWVLEFAPADARSIDPLMGWTSSSDTQSQVKLRFDTREAALDYAKEHGLEVTITEPKKRKPNIRPGGYGDNFATNRRTVWTH